VDDEPLPEIAVVGAGPIGLEAALYARFLGYPTTVFERGRVGERLRDVCLAGEFLFEASRTTLGVAAIKAQDPDFLLPAGHETLTSGQYLARYLVPLADSDLLSDSIRSHTTVVAIRRTAESAAAQGSPEMPPDSDANAAAQFLVDTVSQDGTTETFRAEIVIDCSGLVEMSHESFRKQLPERSSVVISEIALGRMQHGLPQAAGKDRERYAGRRTLVIGDGEPLRLAARQLVSLRRVSSATRIGLLNEYPSENQVPQMCPGPHRGADSDLIPAECRVDIPADAMLSQLEFDVAQDRFRATFRCDRQIFEEMFDRVLWLAPRVVDSCLDSDLQISVRSGEPMIVSRLPRLYVLGSKSTAGRTDFLLSTGYRQIRDAFRTIGQRDELDLYATLAYLA